MKFYILLILNQIFTTFSIFTKFMPLKFSLPFQGTDEVFNRAYKNDVSYNTSVSSNTHFWETRYGYNVLECSEIKKFDKMSMEMICSLF
jgi:hypothetical protein